MLALDQVAHGQRGEHRARRERARRLAMRELVHRRDAAGDQPELRRHRLPVALQQREPQRARGGGGAHQVGGEVRIGFRLLPARGIDRRVGRDPRLQRRPAGDQRQPGAVALGAGELAADRAAQRARPRGQPVLPVEAGDRGVPVAEMGEAQRHHPAAAQAGEQRRERRPGGVERVEQQRPGAAAEARQRPAGGGEVGFGRIGGDERAVEAGIGRGEGGVAPVGAAHQRQRGEQPRPGAGEQDQRRRPRRQRRRRHGREPGAAELEFLSRGRLEQRRRIRRQVGKRAGLDARPGHQWRAHAYQAQPIHSCSA